MNIGRHIWPKIPTSSSTALNCVGTSWAKGNARQAIVGRPKGLSTKGALEVLGHGTKASIFQRILGIAVALCQNADAQSNSQGCDGRPDSNADIVIMEILLVVLLPFFYPRGNLRWLWVIAVTKRMEEIRAFIKSIRKADEIADKSIQDG